MQKNLILVAGVLSLTLLGGCFWNDKKEETKSANNQVAAVEDVPCEEPQALAEATVEVPGAMDAEPAPTTTEEEVKA